MSLELWAIGARLLQWTIGPTAARNNRRRLTNKLAGAATMHLRLNPMAPMRHGADLGTAHLRELNRVMPKPDGARHLQGVPGKSRKTAPSKSKVLRHHSRLRSRFNNPPPHRNNKVCLRKAGARHLRRPLLTHGRALLPRALKRSGERPPHHRKADGPNRQRHQPMAAGAHLLLKATIGAETPTPTAAGAHLPLPLPLL